VICSSDPNSAQAVYLTLTQEISPIQSGPDNLSASPWVLVLANRATCSLFTGATGQLDGQPETYGCSDHSTVIGSLNRAGPTWVATIAPEAGGPTSTEPVSKAYF